MSVRCLVHLQSVQILKEHAKCREGNVIELLAKRAALQKEFGQQKERHAQAQQHLRVSTGSHCDLSQQRYSVRRVTEN